MLRLSGSIPITSLLIIFVKICLFYALEVHRMNNNMNVYVYMSTGIMMASSDFCNIISDNMKSVMVALS